MASGGGIPWISYEGDSGAFETKHTGLRTVVGLTCSLSALGSLLILFSYVCFKKFRSRSREILMHIAIMDLGVSLANLIGDVVYFDQYYHSSAPDNSTMVELLSSTESRTGVESFSAKSYINGLCKAQAFFAAYFTLGSVFWTVFLGLYIYLCVLYQQEHPKVPNFSLRVSYFFSYSFPLLISLWLVLTHRLGYAPYNSSGWCSLIIKDPSTGDVNLFVAMFANDLWIYLASVLILIFYATSHVYAHWLLDDDLRQHRSLIYKFLFIPLVFVLLRLWTSILNILYVYVGLEEEQVPFWVNEALVYLAGIGDSGQGFANAILFVLFSRKVRTSFWRCLRCRRQVIDIPATPANTFEGESLQRHVDGGLEETSHLLTRSLEDGSLLIENRSYGSINTDSVVV